MMRATCQFNWMNEAIRHLVGRFPAVGLLVSLLMVTMVSLVSAQIPANEESYAVFVSQRNGSSQLFILDLNSRQISQLTDTGRGHYDPMAATGGSSLVFSSRQGAGFELYRADLGMAWRSRRPGLVGVNRLTVNVMDEVSPSLTADGSTVVFHSGLGIETMSSTGSNRRVVLPKTERAIDISPIVSPDGKMVAFISNRGDVENARYDVWLLSRETSELRQLTRGAEALGGLSWSGDSKRIAFTTMATSTRMMGIGLAEVEGSTFRILTEQNDSNPSLSTRGDRMLFVSSRDGDQEVYLLNLNGGRAERLTHSAGLDDSPIFMATPNVARPSRSTP
ncbi:MAG: TolB family protein [Blastocatellia bacterium]